MNVVVTGGAGFIGANLCRALLDDDEITRVTVIDDLSTGDRENLNGLDVDLREGSILDQDLVSKALAGATAVVHLGARPSVPRSIKDPRKTHDANATGTLNVLEGARSTGVGLVIIASSSSVYGGNPEIPKHEGLAPMPLSPYAASKLATESYGLAYQSSFDLAVLALRFFNVFGPLQRADHAYAAVIPSFISAALRGEQLKVFGDGNQTRDFTFVETVVAVIRDAIRRQVSHKTPVNLAFGTRTSLLVLISLLESILGRSVEVQHLPPRVGDVRDSQADSSLLQELFPAVTPVDLETGLKATLNWFQSSVITEGVS
jgi:UDP-glucose 4-epimerase